MEYKGPCLCHIKMVEIQQIIPRVLPKGDNKSLEYMFPYINDEELEYDLKVD